MYIVLVGPPGSRKGTAMKPAKRIMMQKAIKLSANATTKEALIRALRVSSESTSDALTGKTIGHASLTVYSEELTVFLGYNNLELMGYMNNWYDCEDPWEYDTKDVTLRDYIDAVWVNLLGAATPSILRLALPNEAVGAGLTSRIIFVHADGIGKTVPITYITEEAQKTREDLFADLERIYMLSGKFTYTKDFINRYIDWRVKQDANPPFSDPSLLGYNARRSAHVLKLCMIVSASESDDMVITDKVFNRSLSTLERVEVDMPRVFSEYGESRDVRVMNRVMRSVALAGETGILFSTLMDRSHRDADKDMMWRVIRTLESMKFCRRDVSDPADTRIIYVEESKEEESA